MEPLMSAPPPPSEPSLDPAQLERLRDVPLGAVTLSGVAVLLLLLGWLFVYFLFYLPRGMVG